MDEKELAEIEDWNDKRWKQVGQQEKDYVVVRDLIAEVRRLNAEVEKLKRKRSAIEANLSLDYLKDPLFRP